MLAWLERADPFPPVERALKNPSGLLCAGADLSEARLLDAYRRGIFPWYSGGEPILWWSPDPRMVLYTDELKVPRSLAKSTRNKGYEVRIDTAFAAVLDGCADRPQTWLGADMRKAYLRLLDWRVVRWQSRGQFFATTARMMRRVLVDAARERRAARCSEHGALEMLR